MSFQDLVSDLAQSEKEIVFTVNGKELKFTAVSKPFFELQGLSIKAKEDDKNYVAALLVAAVTDENGDYMTYEQAMSLPPKYARPLMEAVLEVNGMVEEEEKN